MTGASQASNPGSIVCAQECVLGAGLKVPAAASLLMAPTHHIKLLECIPVSTHVQRYRFEKPAGFFFKPGQYAMLSCAAVKTPAGVPLRRAMSIASTPQEPFLEFCVARGTPAGLAHHLQYAAKSGDLFSLDGPYGRFFFERPAGRTIFVAGGTGVAPLRSMLCSLSDEDFSRGVTLFFGIRNPANFIYRDELEAYAATGKLTLVVAISEDVPGWKGKRGHISDVLAAELPPADGAHLYVCGPPPMVLHVIAEAVARGYSESQVHREQW